MREASSVPSVVLMQILPYQKRRSPPQSLDIHLATRISLWHAQSDGVRLKEAVVIGVRILLYVCVCMCVCVLT